MNAPAHHLASEIAAIATDRLYASPTNPRKHFDSEQISDLAASIGKQGVLQPLLVRPDNPLMPTRYEIVCGERRWRACKEAGLQVLPCMVRQLSDVEVLEIQVVENLQRADLHPMEEAEGYEALMKQHLYTVEDIAAKVGKSKAYVYGRLKLTALSQDARKWFFSGKLSASTALLVARIPVPSLQKKAAELIGDPKTAREPLGFREASELVQREFMLGLKDAPFPTNDTALVPGAGSCTACPRRTGNNPDLFADVSSGDTCTDPACFKAKRETWVKLRLDEAEASGRTVLRGKEAKAIKPSQYGPLKGYHDLDAQTWEHGAEGKKLRTVLGRGVKPTAVMEDPHRPGVIIEMVSDETFEEVAAEKGLEKPRRPSADDGKRAAEKEERDREAAFRKRLFAKIHQRRPVRLSKEDLLLVAERLVDSGDLEQIVALWGWTFDPNNFSDEEIGQAMAELSEGQLCSLIIELMLSADLSPWSNGERLLATAKRVGVDQKRVRAELAAEQRAAEKAKPAAGDPLVDTVFPPKKKAAKKPAAKKAPAKKKAAKK